jgi:hypothetical protein
MKKWHIGVGLGVLALLAGGYFVFSTDTRLKDELCSKVLERFVGFHCPNIVAGQGVFAPGSIVQLLQLDSGEARVSTPSSYLSNCVLPGSTLDLFEHVDRSTRQVSLPQITYKLEQNIFGKVDWSIPGLLDVLPKGKGAWASVNKMQLRSSRSWILTLDENVLAENITGCNIKKSCVDRVVALNDRIINSALLAEGLEFEFLDSDDRNVSVEEALKSGEVEIEVKLDPSSNYEVGETVRSDEPVVLAVTLVRKEILQSVDSCDEDVIINSAGAGVEGNARVAIFGGGGNGNIGSGVERVASLGQPINAGRTGSEDSQCNAGSVTRSRATADALVYSSEAGVLGLKATLSTNGGHYRTVAQCLLGRPIGFTGHDNSATARAQLDGVIRVLVRKETPSTLVTNWSDLPAGSRLTVTDPFGNPLINSMEVTGDGEERVQIEQPGMYLVRPSISTTLSKNGAARDNLSFDGRVSVRVE